MGHGGCTTLFGEGVETVRRLGRVEGEDDSIYQETIPL